MLEGKRVLLIVSAIFAFLSFPPSPLGPAIFFMPAILLFVVENLEPRRAFKYGYCWGIIFYFGLAYYIAWVTIPGMIATVMIMALVPGSACWIFTRLLDRNKFLALVFIPSYLIAWNWLLTMSEFNYPWFDYGYALSYYLPLIQAADIGGVYLISLAILIANILIYLNITARITINKIWRNIMPLGIISIVLALSIYGNLRLKEDNGEHSGGLRVSVAQGNITEDIKWDPNKLYISFDRYFDLSRKAAADDPDLIIWPETAIPTYLMQEDRHRLMIQAFVDSLNIPVLTGIPYYIDGESGEYVAFNSAVLIKPQATEYQVYSKIHLVPMSERIPYSDPFKKLKEIRLGQADFSSGRDMTVFNLDGFKFSTLICFESAFPGFCREFCRMGAQFLVVITNDMWFGRTSLYEQHAMMSVFRAIENRVPVARAGNTGISMAVDKYGRILMKSGTFTQEFLTADICPGISSSTYNRIGDIIPMILTSLSILAIAVAFSSKKKYFRPEDQ